MIAHSRLLREKTLSTDDLDPSLLIFAVIALFVLWRLRSVLGERTERDLRASRGVPHPGSAFRLRPIAGGASAGAPSRSADEERWKGLAEGGSKAWAGLDAIAAVDPSFSGRHFIDGARRAYDMIVSAFAKGDRETLRRLLSTEVYGRFAAEMDAREERGETAEAAVVSIDSATVEDAAAVGQNATITVRFASRLMSTRRDRGGAVIDGGSGQTVALVDLWTFSRDPKAQDPNWKLVATTTAH